MVSSLIINPFTIFLVAFLTTYFIIPKIIWVVNSRDLIDKPDHRSSHQSSTPTMAGVSFFLAIIMVVFFIKKEDVDNIGVNLIAALTIIFIVGLKDDLVVSTPKAKIGGQLLAIGIMIISGMYNFTDFNNFLGIGVVPLFITVPLVVFSMLAIINSYNLIDGIDGLASIIGIVIFSGFATIFYFLDLNYYFLISLSFMGVLFAYLRYNFSKSKKIFMGDTGSLIIGFCIAFLTMKFLTIDYNIASKAPFLIENRIIVALSILFIPLFDTIRVIGVRLLDGKSPFYPDRNHIHHILVDFGFSHRRASFCIGFINFLVASIMFYVTQKLTIIQSLMILISMFFIAFTVLFLMNKNQTAIRLKVKIKKSMVKLLSL